jgi:hypothetical protein
MCNVHGYLFALSKWKNSQSKGLSCENSQLLDEFKLFWCSGIESPFLVRQELSHLFRNLRVNHLFRNLRIESPFSNLRIESFSEPQELSHLFNLGIESFSEPQGGSPLEPQN